MTTATVYQKLPSGVEREHLRDKGQFWTPGWIAKAMVAYVANHSDLVFDPAVGEGSFCSALIHLNEQFGEEIDFYGTDVDPAVIKKGYENKIYGRPGIKIETRDFIFDPPRQLFKAIVANPPYIRHHRLSLKTKERLREISLSVIGSALDGRAGVHIYFLVQALSMLQPNGKLAFIMPADTCEGVFSKKLWGWISSRFCVDGVITFQHEATPFPGVDTNPLIFLIQNNPPSPTLHWIRCHNANSNALFESLRSGFSYRSNSLEIHKRTVGEAVETGFSRPPRAEIGHVYKLSDFAKVMRGIATGANGFFFLTVAQAKALGISEEFLKPAIGRTRDVDGCQVTEETIRALESKGRPTRLFAPDGRALAQFPFKVKRYLSEGERLGINKNTLISTRNPWYKMEVRRIPDFLFAYLGRRNARFIRNKIGVVPLTGFLCVYSLSSDADYIEKLWKLLQAPEVIKNLALVGKSYGSGAIKVEPRSLQELPIPAYLVEGLSLKPPSAKAADLFGKLRAGTNTFLNV